MIDPSVSRRLTAELYTLIERSERLPPEGTERDELVRRSRELAGRCRAAAEASGPGGPDVPGALAAVGAALSTYAERLAREGDGAASPQLRTQWEDLTEAYERLAVQTRRSGGARDGELYLGRIKPRNVVRNMFHISNGLVSLVLYEWFVGRWTMVAIGTALFASFVTLDRARRRWPDLNRRIFATPFGSIARPIDVYAMPSSTWYAASLVLGTILFPKTAIEIGAIVLSLADPAAAWVGKRYGRRKIYRDRSWVGTASFMVTGWTASMGFLLWRRPELGLATALLAATAAVLAGAVAELLGDQVEDNFTIPLAAGAAAALVLY